MRIVIASILISPFMLGACASMYGTPEQRRIANAALPDYSLCEKLAIGTLAPDEVRMEWATELENRGADCNKYAGMLKNAVQRNQLMLNMGLQMMQQPSYVPQSVPFTSGSSGNGSTCYKVRDWVSGFNRNCVYSCLGSETVQTVGAAELCPLTIP